MKKIIVFLLIVMNTICYAQKIIVTTSGIKDLDNAEKTYVVINADGKTAKELYENALKYVNKTYKSPDDVIKGKTEYEYLKIITHVENFLIVNNSGAKISIDADYTYELSFKDGKVKFEIINLIMSAKNGGYKVLFTGGLFDGYPIYNKKGDLKRPETKSDIENYFNSQILKISDFLQGKNEEDKW